MINPLSIASDGYLNCGTPLTIWSRGYLSNCDITPVDPPIIPIDFDYPSRGGYKGGKDKKGLERIEWMKEFIKREDEEILVILKAFVQCQ